MIRTRNLRPTPRLVEPGHLAAAAAFLILAIPLGFMATGRFPWELLYVAFIAATIVVVRTIPRAPGGLLRRRAVRRVLVASIGSLCVALLLPCRRDRAPCWGRKNSLHRSPTIDLKCLMQKDLSVVSGRPIRFFSLISPFKQGDAAARRLFCDQPL